MEKIKTLLVDDEIDSREVLQKLLGDFFPEIDIVGEAANVEDAYKLVEKHKAQLVFLDIQMPKANGFALLEKYQKVPFEVVFVTSYDKYAINAIKFSALDYLLKPVEIPDLKEAVNKAMESLGAKNNKTPQIVNLLHSLDTDIPDKKIAVHAGEKVKLLSELNIVYIEGDHRYCHIHMNDGDTYTTAKYLRDFEEYLNDNFIRVSKTFLINTRQIKEYSKTDPCVIEMVDGKSFEVARRKKGEVLERLKK
jgi:two-component system, LytTR family, response regulator